MPSKSIAQQHLFQAAEHGADFPMAKKVQKSMTTPQMHDFAAGSEVDKPEHVIKGDSKDVIGANVNTLKNSGMNELEATQVALRTSKGHPHRHKNLGGFLHKKKS